jgi:formylmethanofuran dehydrogenase subunit A
LRVTRDERLTSLLTVRDGKDLSSALRLADLDQCCPPLRLYPRKGTVSVGSDADLVVLDPQLHRQIDGRSMQSRAGYSVYDGREVFGWPRFTVSRGDVVLEDGEVIAPPSRGRWLRRGPTAPL